jgi:hypothetical protein
MEHILPSVTLELGGVQRRLVFDFNAQAAFEEVTGVSFNDLFDKKGRLKISPRLIRGILWASLLHFDEKVKFDEFGRISEAPELSVTDVGKLITRHNLRQVQTATTQAIVNFFKEEKSNEGGGKDASADPQSR